MKLFVIISYLVSKIVDAWKDRLSDSYVDKPMPDNIRDVYNEEEYSRWKSYRKEGRKLDRIENAVNTVVTLIFLLLNVYAWLYYMTDASAPVRFLFLTVVLDLFSAVRSLPFDYYDTFVIEEKYGMNTTTKKTFFLDAVKEFIIGAVVSFAFLMIVKAFFDRFGNKGILGIAIVIVAISLIISLLVMPILRIFNKFTPLPDGELKDELLSLCGKYGVEVKKIVVKDASRRTTTANAFCTGIGKKKIISIDDNLLNDYTTEQIVAVFAHEFAHARLHHITRLLPFGILSTLIKVGFIGLVLNLDSLYTAFGFTELNVYFALIAVNMFYWPLSLVLDYISNGLSRKFEYAADAFAAKEGYGDALISALKKLCKESLSNINPHPLIVKMDYSHPTLSQRIEAIRKNEHMFVSEDK